MARPPVVAVLQHTAVEGLGRLERSLAKRSIATEIVGPEMPVPADLWERTDGVIVLGGPMGVYETDRHPRLRSEMDLLTRALAAERPILGICLGSQLLAAVLGARVAPGPQKEIGWFDVALQPAAREDALFRALPPRFKALHWHGDVFDLPPGATHLASSALTPCQAFAYGARARGLLFHLEAGPSQVEAMARAFPEDVDIAGASPEELVRDARSLEASTAALGETVFGAWASLVEAPRR